MLAENWPPRRGGIENYLMNIARHLGEGGTQVTVVAPEAGHRSGIMWLDEEKRRINSTPEESAGAEWPGVKVIRHRFFWRMMWPRWLPLAWYLKREAGQQKWDVVLCGKGLFEGLVGYYLKKRLGVPYIVFVYAMEIGEWSNNWWQKRKLRYVLTAADRIIYINDVVKDAVQAQGVKAEQLVKIWPGVSRQTFGNVRQEDLDRVRQRYNLPVSYVLCVARLVRRKGVDLLLAGLAKVTKQRLETWHLVVVGDGPERENLTGLAKQLGISKQVHFLGEVPDKDLPALYASAGIFAMTPRAAEGFGIVYIEAASQELPAVTTRVVGAPEAVINEKTGLVVAPEAAAIAGALERLMSDEQLRRLMGSAALGRVHEQFWWDKRIALVRGVLDGLK